MAFPLGVFGLAFHVSFEGQKMPFLHHFILKVIIFPRRENSQRDACVFLQSCVSCVDLLREGRGALATSFASYRFLMQYGCGFSCIKLFGYYYGIILSAAVRKTLF
eukprot:COSAG06_NODE_4125_length_4545_cov_30.309862_6_plen_106_part_00